MPRLITIHEWAREQFGDAAPCEETLRRWARGGRIVPRAQKIGRSYWVSTDARYVDPYSPQVDKMSPGVVSLSSDLMQRMFGAQTPSRRQPSAAAQPLPPR